MGTRKLAATASMTVLVLAGINTAIAALTHHHIVASITNGNIAANAIFGIVVGCSAVYIAYRAFTTRTVATTTA